MYCWSRKMCEPPARQLNKEKYENIRNLYPGGKLIELKEII